MQERHRPGQGDFPDWDNPEDREDDTPEDYYDEDDDSYIPDESDPDYDLSEAHGYAGWEPAGEETFPRWIIAAASLLLIIAILIPLFIRIS